MAKELSGTLSELVVERDMLYKSIDDLKEDISALKRISGRSERIKKGLASSIGHMQVMLREDESDLRQVMKAINAKQHSFLS